MDMYHTAPPRVLSRAVDEVFTAYPVSPVVNCSIYSPVDFG
jgi:hypothetical protein